MAKENKSTTILLLVVAGVLLFLVGSFTGQAYTFGSIKTRLEGQSCNKFLKCSTGLECINWTYGTVCRAITTPTNTIQPTTGLTTNQKLDVLNMFNKCFWTSEIEKLQYETISGNDVCSRMDSVCVFAEKGPTEQLDNLITINCDFKEIKISTTENKISVIKTLCCKA